MIYNVSCIMIFNFSDILSQLDLAADGKKLDKGFNARVNGITFKFLKFSIFYYFLWEKEIEYFKNRSDIAQQLK